MAKPLNAVITGSTSGIGLGIAQAFAAKGMNIMLNGFGDADEIEANRAQIENDYGVRALYHNADMTKPSEIHSLIESAERAFGRVDILVNNAGIQFVSKIEDFPEDKWLSLIHI